MDDEFIVSVDHNSWSHHDVALLRRHRITLRLGGTTTKLGLHASPQRALSWISRELHKTIHSLTGIDPEEAKNVQLVFPMSSIEEALSLIMARFNRTRQHVHESEVKFRS